MSRTKVGTILRKELYDELRSFSENTGVPVSELLERGIVLLLREQAVRTIRELGERRTQPAGAARRVLRFSRRELEGRGRKKHR